MSDSLNKSLISQTFSVLKSKSQMAFMPFITAGDPDLNFTLEMIRTLKENGADLIEIGFPYSDPVADGPVIQASYTRAQNQGISVEQIFEAIGSLKNEECCPLVAMVSFAIIFRLGPKEFVKRACDAGFSGFIVPDLPAEEAEEMLPLCKEYGVDLIQLIAPTTSAKRTQQVIQSSSGFLYCVAVAGITGERQNIKQELIEQLASLRTETDLPLSVGFGISKPEHVDPLRESADGVIVGSALVRMFEQLAENRNDEQARKAVLEEAGAFAKKMSTKAHGQ